jgi:hypothetical protein
MGFHKGVTEEHFVLTLQEPMSAFCNAKVFNDAFNQVAWLTSFEQGCLAFCQLNQVSGIEVQHVLLSQVLRGCDEFEAHGVALVTKDTHHKVLFFERDSFSFYQMVVSNERGLIINLQTCTSQVQGKEKWLQVE